MPLGRRDVDFDLVGTLNDGPRPGPLWVDKSNVNLATTYLVAFGIQVSCCHCPLSPQVRPIRLHIVDHVAIAGGVHAEMIECKLVRAPDSQTSLALETYRSNINNV